ncbi:MAG TPA: DNA polymerase I [Firmicutes bacterium]|nr:DNA polymerase I [Bacillota bacterium]
MQKRLFLIDGNSLINRAFYALPPLTNASGEPTNAVYGLTQMLFRLREDYSPDQILVTFDVSGPTFRHDQFEEYKANRKGMPDDLRSQIPVMKELLDKLGINRLELQGYEADDLLGTVAKQGESEGYEVFIVTGDRDAFQLISSRTSVLFTKRGITETELVNEETLRKNYGLTPSQVIDLKGLMGDSSDNIPGVPGVGEKTALRLLESYHSMEGVYAHLNELKGKLKENLETYERQAFMSKELATIRLNAPVQVDLGELREMDRSAVREMFAHLGFKTLLERFSKDDAMDVQPSGSWDASFKIPEQEGFAEVLGQIQNTKRVYLSYASDHNMLFVLVENAVWAMKEDQVREHRDALRTALQGKEVYATHGKDVLHALRAEGSDLVSFDLELALYCLDPEKRWDPDVLAQHFQKPQVALDPKTLEYQAVYLRLYRDVVSEVEQELKKDDLWELYVSLELPLVTALADMEAHGILVDPEKLALISQELEDTLERLTELIYAEAGEEFNINSPKQLGVILFDKLGLPVLKRTKTGPSTSADVLEELSDHPIVASVLEYRQVAKLKSTYTDSLAELISPETKRIHTTFNQTVTATGRLSSTHPNLQNIPIRTAEGRRIREAFVAPEGHVLLMADYSQIELRLLAHLSGDQVLANAFRSGQDIHAQTAAEVFGLALDEVTSEQRSAAKAINFGIIYGISSFGLAKGINLTRAQAQEYIDSYFLRYPMVKSYLDGLVEQGKKEGYVQTLSKRRRYLPNLKSRNFALRNFAARTAMNTPIQGSAADIIKLAMLRVYRALKDEGLRTRILLQVHDELVLETPEDELDVAARLVRREMEEVYPLDVPLEVGVFYGPNWRDVQSYDYEEKQ